MATDIINGRFYMGRPAEERKYKMIANEKTMTVSEAAKYLGYCPPSVYYHIGKGHLEVASYNQPKRVTRASVERLKTLQGYSEKGKPRIETPFIYGIYRKAFMIADLRAGYPTSNPPAKQYNGRVGVTEDGEVFNLLTGHKYTPKAARNGRFVVWLPENVTILLSRLVAFTWCDNGRFADIVHHIDGNGANDSPHNLLWMFHDEHVRAHELMKEAEASEDNSNYISYINEIRTLNTITPEQRKRGITWKPAEDNTSEYVHVFYISEDAAKQIESGERTINTIDPSEIFHEYVNAKPKLGA